MGKKKRTKKLSVKKQTLRKLDSLTDEQLKAAAGGTEIQLKYNYQLDLGGDQAYGGIKTGGPIGSVGCTIW